ncbi:NUDIX hydrolase [Luteimonas notoginsengisoli]|jgi:8-oxo-dGTP pyrophosphatase MutT (NUDIX family)|uniref:NUDIX hydrolase n=1 Tax=Luteimonas notoginsengisoli TaxID=1578200 RepID=A0ABV7URG1_9GAMM
MESENSVPHRNIAASPDPQLRAALRDYARRWPAEALRVEDFLALLADRADPFARERIAGHFTASAWLVDRSGRNILLTHHRKLGMWLQLGGHADGDRDLARTALREAEEESGLSGLQVVEGIFDLDRHRIPEHKDVPAHWHYDVRYIVQAGDDEDFVVSDESHALAWRDIESLAVDETADASLRRMAAKWLDRPAGP